MIVVARRQPEPSYMSSRIEGDTILCTQLHNYNDVSLSVKELLNQGRLARADVALKLLRITSQTRYVSSTLKGQRVKLTR